MTTRSRTAGAMPAITCAALLAPLLAACPPADPGGRPLPGDPFAVVVTTDYVDTMLATIDLATGEATDGVSAFASGDVAADSHGGDLYAIFRAEAEIARYPGFDLASAPDLSVSAGEGSNPHRTAICGERLFVSLYDASAVLVLDPDGGAQIGVVDLAAWAEEGGDGRSEPATMLVDGGLLHVVLERFDFTASQSAPTSVLATIDCASLDVVQTRELPRNVRAWWSPGRSGELLVLSGGWFDLDGAIARYDMQEEAVTETLLDEVALGADITDIVPSGDAILLAAWDWEEQVFDLACLPLDGGPLRFAAEGLRQNVWNLQEAPGGDVWAFLTLTTGDEGLSHGVARLGPEECSLAAEDDWWTFGLPATEAAFP